MARMLLVCVFFVVPTAMGFADPSAPPTQTVIHFAIQPIAAPKPALKYRLLPQLAEMSPGNPVQGYLKAFMEQQHFFFDPAVVKEREAWASLPLDQLPVKQYPDYGKGNPLRQVDQAARLLTPDWQVLLQEKKDGYDTLLPDVQQQRLLATALKVRSRFEIAERRFDDAIATAKTMLAMSQHLGQHPSWIGNLVGLAIASQAVETLEEMVQQPGCPNLYWALADLPDPLVSFREGTRGEQLLFDAEFPGLTAAHAMAEPQLRRVTQKLLEQFRYEQGNQKKARTWLDAAVRDESGVEAARKRLVEAGVPEQRVSQFPPLQVILLDMRKTFRADRDEHMKWMSLPYRQAEQGLLALRSHSQDHDHPFQDLRTFNSLKILQAQNRLQQRLAMLRHVEAIRLYAAAQEGKLPAHLGDIAVPLPDDPFTGQPFRYELKGNTATLRGTPPRGLEKVAVYNLVYTLTMRR